MNIIGFLKVIDLDTNSVIVDTHNSINHENLSLALANSFSDKKYGPLYSMVFGSGGSVVDVTGVVSYLTTNTVGANAQLYNKVFEKIVNTNYITNTYNDSKIDVVYEQDKEYTDVVISCILEENEPYTEDFVFDEIGLMCYDNNNKQRLISHAIFHPVIKPADRRRQIDYTIRISSQGCTVDD